MDVRYSFIVPVYNRPEEIQELLESSLKQKFQDDFEIVIVEDGSENDSKDIINKFKGSLNISYFYKENTGPGDSRNFGMQHAQGNYFLVLDSDCILPENYLSEVDKELQSNFVHCFGGPDAAHGSFSDVQKGINYAMTSIFTTGGIRGNKKSVGKFQPRSFNMGISKEAFEKTSGFGNIHPGEDPDLTFRLWKVGYQTRLLPKAYVYHKRRIDWKKFKIQVYKFGLVRPILNKWHPDTKKLTYWFPSVFMVGFLIALILLAFRWFLPILCYLLYFVVLFLDSLLKNRSLKIAFWSVYATIIQFYGYGKGFLKSTFLLTFKEEEPEEIFPKLFFKKK